MSRKRTPKEIETAVLINSARRCALCFHLARDLREKLGQIAHLDGDASNYAEDNLAWMCLDHHTLFDSKTSQNKNYTVQEVKAARSRLYEAIVGNKHASTASPEPQAAATPATSRAFTSKLPAVDALLIGRGAELRFLDAAWSDPNVNIVQIIAPGGTGKTALTDRWFRRHVKDSTIFGWSFYSEGTSENREVSSDDFVEEFLQFFHVALPSGASVWARAAAIAEHLRKERVLLILDGLDSSGEMRDSLMKALLKELRTHNRGMALCSTRFRIGELPDDENTRSCDLGNLQPEDGGRYLRELGCQGTDDELTQSSKDFGNHALALTLLGTYIADFHQGDIRRRSDIRELMVDETDAGRHAKKVMASYAQVFEGKPELDILRVLGYFDRPAEPEAVLLLLPQMSDLKHRAALSRLFKARLIYASGQTNHLGHLDSHPLVREYFASVMRTTARSEFEAGHNKLYELYCKKAADKPDTREGLMPLFHAVYHGCHAGRYEEVRTHVYRDRINHGENNFYLVRVLGQFGTNLSLLANLFLSTLDNACASPTPTSARLGV
jgi:hypothetical protein